MLLKLSIVLCGFLLSIFAASLPSQNSCAVTRVNAYDYACALRGWVQTPKYSQQLQNVTSVTNCAGACLSDNKCLSFRYRAESKRCDLYRRRLGSMAFTSEVFQSGLYFDQVCYSNKCNVITACQAVETCRTESVYNGYTQYSFYACGYGVTSHFHKKPQQKLFGPSLSACDAVLACAKQRPDGPMDVHVDLNTGNWVCLLYNTVDYYETYLHPQHINPLTFTLANSSVGASYGYWWSYEYSD